MTSKGLTPPAATEGGVIEAGGGIVECSTPNGLRIAVVLRKRYENEWALPKGKRVAGESWQDTALREVREETSLSARIVSIAGASTYAVGGSPKLVVYWRMRVDEVSPFVPNDETARLEWWTPEEAVTRLSHQDQSQLVAAVYGLDARRAARSWLATAWSSRAASVVQATRWRRLVAEVEAYRGEIEGRALAQQRLSDALPAILRLLTLSGEALERGDMESGWRSLHAARRLELLGLDDVELQAAAQALRAEAEKLDGWRRKAVTDLVEQKEGAPTLPANVFRAASLRDEHYDNQAYKDALRRGHAVRLAIALAGVVGALVLWVKTGALNGAEWARAEAAGVPSVDLYQALVSVALFGLLGATVSAALAAPVSSGTTRIPETTSTVRVTVLRLFMGPAAAILLYFVCQSKLAKSLFRFDTADAFTVLAIAFVAGFSERLVLRVVEAIVGKAKEADPAP